MVLCNLIPDAVLIIGLICGIVIGYKIGFVRVLLSGIFKRVVSLVCAFLLSKPIGKLIGEKFFLTPVTNRLSGLIMKSIGEDKATLSAEELEHELPKVVKWLLDFVNVDVSKTAGECQGQVEDAVNAFSAQIASPIARFLGVAIAIIGLYIIFRIAFSLIRAILNAIMNLPGLRIINKSLGLVFGFLFSVLFLWGILSAIDFAFIKLAGAQPFFANYDISQTYLAKYLSGSAPIDFIFSIK